jgi:hypothetical protein
MGSRNWNLWTVTVTLVGTAWACTPEPPQERPPVLQETTAPESKGQAAPQPPELDPAAMSAIAQALIDIEDRQQCNRVMGCKPSLELQQYGRAAVAPILRAVTSTTTDRYWRVRLIEVLGQLDDERAIPTLERFLSSSRWEVRCRAAIGLGRLGSKASTPRLQRMVEEHPDPDDPVSRVAALVALDRLGATYQGAPARDRLALAFPTSPEELGPLNPGYYSFLAEAVREARLSSAIELVRLGARHRDRFVREASLRTLSALQDTGGIPVAIGRLDDPLPAIQRLALATLQQITGSHTITTPEQWKAWCEKRGCRGPRATPTPP